MRMTSAKVKKPNASKAMGCFAASRCPAKICVAHRRKPLITVRKQNTRSSSGYFQIRLFLPSNVMRYFVILADCTVGCSDEGRRISLWKGPVTSLVERKSGSSTG